MICWTFYYPKEFVLQSNSNNYLLLQYYYNINMIDIHNIIQNCIFTYIHSSLIEFQIIINGINKFSTKKLNIYFYKYINYTENQFM